MNLWEEEVGSRDLIEFQKGFLHLSQIGVFVIRRHVSFIDHEQLQFRPINVRSFAERFVNRNGRTA